MTTGNNLDDLLQRANDWRWKIGEGYHDSIIESLYQDASRIASSAVTESGKTSTLRFERTLDRILTNTWTGFPIMLMMLAGVFWLTIQGANVPSQLLSTPRRILSEDAFISIPRVLFYRNTWHLQSSLRRL